MCLQANTNLWGIAYKVVMTKVIIIVIDGLIVQFDLPQDLFTSEQLISQVIAAAFHNKKKVDLS